jgi:ribose transport system permease protein
LNIRKLFQFKEFSMLLSLIIICVVTTIINPSFSSIDNILDVLRSISFYAIVAVGMSFVIVSAGIDLSVGSTIALTGIITGYSIVHGLPVPLAILFGIITGMVVGAINGFTIVRFKIPPFIATLGMMYVAKGVVYVISKGQPMYPFPDSFNQIAQGSYLGIPYSIYIALIVIVIGHFTLNYTVFGRSIMAVGGNEETSRTSGISVARTKIAAYVIIGGLSSITGILLASRLSSAQASAGDGWEMTIIAAVIIGGTSLFGGTGSILGTVIGVAIMSVLSNAMVLLQVSVYWQKIVVGIIIVLAVGIDTRRRNKMSGNKR